VPAFRQAEEGGRGAPHGEPSGAGRSTPPTSSHVLRTSSASPTRPRPAEQRPRLIGEEHAQRPGIRPRQGQGRDYFAFLGRTAPNVFIAAQRHHRTHSAGSAATVHDDVYMPASTDGRDVDKGLQEYYRRNRSEG